MDWPNERYVRLFTRNTTTWRRLLWDGQCMLLHLLRVVDRAGVLDIQDMEPAEACAMHTGAPPDVAERGIAKMLELGVVVHEGTRLRFPNFLEAQECPMTDKQRAKVSREKRASQNVTAPSQDVTVKSQVVTQPSHGVTARHSSSVPSLNYPTHTTSGPVANDQSESGGGSIEIGPKGTEHEGYRWLHETLGTFPADLASWRADYAAIGAKPEAERLQVARNVQATAWLMEKRSRATPGHLRKHWASFLEGPRNFDQPKPIVAMDFKSQREAAQKAYTKSRLDAFDASEKAFIAMAKTEAERKLRENDWQERRIRLDRSLP